MIENEKKFLLTPELIKQIPECKIDCIILLQRYIFKSDNVEIRVRQCKGITSDVKNRQVWTSLDLKTKIDSTKRRENTHRMGKPETYIPLFNTPTGSPLIIKCRHQLYDIHPTTPEISVDEYLGELTGLFVAEIEITEDTWDDIVIPSWLKYDITHRKEFSNKNLAGKTILDLNPVIEEIIA